MSEAKHTPGPWKFEDEYVRQATGEIVADPYCMETKDTKPGEMEANARLIAAAPDLLAACQLIASNHPRPGRSISEAQLNWVLAAIAKATGQEVTQC